MAKWWHAVEGSQFVRINHMKWLIFNYFALKKRWQLHYVPTISKVVKSTESGAKLPRFKSQLHYLLAAWLWTGYITLISSSVKWVYRNVYFIGLFWRVNEFTYIKHLEQCLAQGNASVSYCVINQSQLWHLFSMRRFFHVLSHLVKWGGLIKTNS